jgi:predicted nucleotide-binding protein with TIR-like domain
MARDPKKVFVIHGRNVDARRELGIFLRSLGLFPLNFSDLRAQMGGTPTIGEIVERGMSEAQGVVALITADELAALRPRFRQPDEPAHDVVRWQARPNVIFEVGMAFGRDRTRVVLVLLGEVSLFTDVAGIHVLRPTNDPSGDRALLRSTLAQGMGCAVEQHSSDWMTHGDLVSCIAGLPEHPRRDPFVDSTSTEETQDLIREFRGVAESLLSHLERLAFMVDAGTQNDVEDLRIQAMVNDTAWSLRSKMQQVLRQEHLPQATKDAVEKVYVIVASILENRAGSLTALSAAINDLPPAR